MPLPYSKILTVTFLYSAQGRRGFEVSRDFSKTLTIRPAARKGYGSIALQAKLDGLLTRGP